VPYFFKDSDLLIRKKTNNFCPPNVVNNPTKRFAEAMVEGKNLKKK
jgi:hypothetical protein